jgi:carboxyl-terminal processing protease
MQTLQKKNHQQHIVLLLTLLFFLAIPGFPARCAAGEQETYQPLFPVTLEHVFPKSEKTFEDIKNLILENYYSEEISEEALYWAAIQGMLRHISPPETPELSKVWTAEAYEKILRSLKGEQVSIGIKSTFLPEEGSLKVTEVLPGGPAESILEPLDRILQIKNQTLKKKSLKEINTLLQGKEGTAITLTVNRGIKIFEVTINRQKFETQTLIASMLSDTIALVEIKSFTADLSKKLEGELHRLEKDGILGIIMDLRNNSGGVFMEALRVAELFLPEKHVLLRTLQRNTGLQQYISVNKNPFSFKIAILVNDKTASAAEIVSSTLQDHNKALVIGSKTFGKGVFEKTFTLNNNFRVKFITGGIYSPKGHSWQSRGITPDFLVQQDQKTLSALLKLSPKKRLTRDVGIITAFKLLKIHSVIPSAANQPGFQGAN